MMSSGGYPFTFPLFALSSFTERASAVAVDIGLSRSEVSSMLPRPTSAGVMPTGLLIVGALSVLFASTCEADVPTMSPSGFAFAVVTPLLPMTIPFALGLGSQSPGVIELLTHTVRSES